MKILYIHQYFVTQSEPGGTRSYWFSKALVQAGHEVIMLTSTNKQRKLIERENIMGIQVIYIRNPYSNNMSAERRFFSFLKFMFISTAVALRQKKVDLVFATSTPLSVGFPALVLKFFKRVPFIFEVRDLWPEFPIQIGAVRNKFIIKILRAFERKIYKNSKHLIALSPGMADGILKTGVIQSKKITLIPNMSKNDIFFRRKVNPEVAKRFRLNKSKFRAVYFGAMGVANGLDYIIDAAGILKKENVYDVEFVFLGFGSAEESLKKKCNIKKLSNVRFLGNQPSHIVSEIVNICNLSLVIFKNLEILRTNSPNKFFDSLSAGITIVVNSAGWTKDIVEKNRCGIFVDPENPKELAEKIILLKNSPELVKEMEENSRKLAEKKYDKTILCKKFVDLIETIL